MVKYVYDATDIPSGYYTHAWVALYPTFSLFPLEMSYEGQDFRSISIAHQCIYRKGSSLLCSADEVDCERFRIVDFLFEKLIAFYQ